jgi:hypothetical protein
MPWRVLGAQVDAVGGSHGDRVGGIRCVRLFLKKST